MEYILSIDQGTTSSKAFLMAMDGSMHKGVSYEVEQFFPNPGYVEQQPEQILSSVLMAISSTLELLGSEDKVISIAITNQRDTTICFDKASGKAFCNAIVWQCRSKEGNVSFLPNGIVLLKKLILLILEKCLLEILQKRKLNNIFLNLLIFYVQVFHASHSL